MTSRGWPSVLAAIAATALIAAGCGGSASHSAKAQPAAVVVMANAPNSLDPAVGDTPEALEADWLAYTPLLTFAHAAGSPGTQLVPGLAQSLPSIADGGTLYTFDLIKGLRYSNGRPVRATDFAWAAERAIRLWPAASRMITGHIVGAAAFAARRAQTISGITTDNASGQITIHLTDAYGALEDVLALPVLAPVPAGTPFTDQQAPPPGVGPYRITDVIPGTSFALLRTAGWQSEGVQSVPSGHLDIDVRITGDAAQNARSVLAGDADVFDSSDQIPPSLLGPITRRASGRYWTRTMGATSLVFLNVTRRPFSSQLAREAVRAGLDQTRLAQLAAGVLTTGCYLLPPTVFGHPQAPCPDGNLTGGGNLTLAKALVRRSGMAGTRVLVSDAAGSPAASGSPPATRSGTPVGAWMTYYTALLNELGFNASLETGSATADAQTGYAGLEDQLPNPVYFYDALTDPHGQGGVDDAYINTTVQALAAVPGTTVSGVSGYWSQLERYLATKAYIAVLGYPTFPEFVSSRIDSGAVVFSPVAGVDWSSLRFK